jgi:hypothetical protein
MPQAASQSTTTRARKHPQAENLRRRMEAAVQRMLDAAERLIAELDAIEPDPDLEDSHDAEAVNEDGGNILDEGHDERWDSGVGDKDGLEEQFGAFVGAGYTRTVPTVDEGDVEVPTASMPTRCGARRTMRPVSPGPTARRPTPCSTNCTAAASTSV